MPLTIVDVTSELNGSPMNLSLADIVSDLAHEFSLTSKVLAGVTDESLSFPVIPGGKTLGDIAWHIVQAIPLIFEQTGVLVNKEGVRVPAPRVATEIQKRYAQVSGSLIAAVQEQWSDELLSQTVSVYGMEWTRAKTLQTILRHEIHHRGQLTLLMRQAGLRVPGVYGPSADDKGAA